MFDANIKEYPLIFIVWNLFLAIIPLAISFVLLKTSKNKKGPIGIQNALLFLAWLFFLPNAPYIITDVRHLNGFCPDTVLDISVQNNWIVFFFFIYSLFGWVLYYYSVELFQVFISKYWKKTSVRLFPILLIPIVSLGLLLGLLDRLNSWDIAVRPLTVAKAAIFYVSDPNGAFNLLVTSLSLYILFYAGKIIFKPAESFDFIKNKF